MQADIDEMISPIVQELARLNELVTDKYADALAEKQARKAYA